MPRRLRVIQPPTTQDSRMNAWLREITNAVNELPNFSIQSTSDGPESNITADSGTLLYDIGSSNTTLWFKNAGDSNNTGWKAIDLI